MFITLEKSGSREALLENCQQMAANELVRGLLIFACDGNGVAAHSFNKELRKISIPLFGGIFPGIISGSNRYKQGSLIVGLSREPKIQAIPNLSNQEADYEELISRAIPEPEGTKTMMILVDGLASRISSLIEGLFNNFGLEFNYIGGGAGSLSMVQKPCLFTNDGLVQDQAIIAMLPADSGVGVNHGWEALAGPFQVTESKNNVIVSIDFQPAFEIYRKALRSHLNQEITPENFFSMAKRHPLGLAKLGAEKLVRDPIAVTPEGAIQCVGEVPEGSYFHILAGSVSSLVNAARGAMQTACAEYPGTAEDKPSLFIDCISRVLYLGGDFQQELNVVQRPDVPLVGALTIGEIGCGGRDYLEFYNKTAVVGVIDL